MKLLIPSPGWGGGDRERDGLLDGQRIGPVVEHPRVIGASLPHASRDHACPDRPLGLAAARERRPAALYPVAARKQQWRAREGWKRKASAIPAGSVPGWVALERGGAQIGKCSKTNFSFVADFLLYKKVE
jgi:hypothetical protein